MTHPLKQNFRLKRPAAFIYAAVYQSGFSALLVLLLFASFLVQPINRAFAAVEDSVIEVEKQAPIDLGEGDSVTSPVLDDPPNQASENINDDPASHDEEAARASPEADLAQESPPTPDASPPANETDESNEPAESPPLDQTENDNSSFTTTPPSVAVEVVDDLAIGEENTTSDADTTDDTPESTDEEPRADDVASPDTEEASSTQPTDVADNTSESEDESSEQDNGNDSNAAVSSANGSEVETATSAPTIILNPNTIVTDDNYYQFSKQSCVRVGEGAYHCSQNSETLVDTQAVVYAEIGVSGNQEIFIRTAKGSVLQITENLYDDSAPHYDPVSRQIAWQRMINDRYQIILYDLDQEKETQLTFTRTNNMEPAVSKDGVVWQVWDDDDWEIMYFDGELADQLTDNETQDLDPVIQDGYIIWTVISDDTQHAQVYTIESGEIMTIANYEGGSIVNPRFVLVYDTQFDNGDIITQGFDPETGFSAPISAKPAPAPIDLPDPDPIGEIKALVQSKSTGKETSESTADPDSAGDNPPSDRDNTASSTNLALDLKSSTTSDLTADAAYSTSSQTNATQNYLELTEYDLVIPSQSGDSAEIPASTTAKTL